VLPFDDRPGQLLRLDLLDFARVLPPPFLLEPSVEVEDRNFRQGRRRDGLKATPQELLAGVIRYAAVMTGKDPRYVKHPTTWLNKGCWTDEHAEPGGFGGRASASTNAVWSAIDAMPARNRRAG
jgi:hypothetical protein